MPPPMSSVVTPAPGLSTVPYERGYHTAVWSRGAKASIHLTGPGFKSPGRISKGSGTDHCTLVSLSGGHAKTSDECEGVAVKEESYPVPNC